MQFSLKEFLAVIGVASIGMASLVYASPPAAVGWMMLLAVLLVRSGVRAVLLPGDTRAWSTGTVLAAVAYLSLLGVQDSGYAVGSQFENEMRPERGWLPTTAAMQLPLFWISDARSYYEDESGNRYKQIPPGAVDRSFDVYMGPNPPANSGMGVTRRSLPDAAAFMTIAHCLWTLLFGYLGGKYAVWVYTRRQQEETA